MNETAGHVSAVGGSGRRWKYSWRAFVLSARYEGARFANGTGLWAPRRAAPCQIDSDRMERGNQEVHRVILCIEDMADLRNMFSVYVWLFNALGLTRRCTKTPFARTYTYCSLH